MLYLLVALVAFALALTVHLLTRPGAHKPIRAGAVVMIGAVSALAFSDVAHAQDIVPDNSVGEIRLSALTVTLLISVFIPILTAIATKLGTNDTVKGLMTLVLNLVSASVVSWQLADGSAVVSQETLVAALIGFVISVASYLGFYKPVNLNSKMAPEKGL